MRIFVTSLLMLLLTASLAPSVAFTAVKDTWKTKSITLKNEMEVYLISDPDAVQSAISIDVGVGGMSDPADHQGMAHFLEHLLFLGTKRFPESNSYGEFLEKNGGGNNAYTSGETTNYYLAVNHDAFEEAIDRISDFFISPLFDAKYVDRERSQVNSEHQKNIYRQQRRGYRISEELANPKHPFSQFLVGSLETLANTKREDVIAFYERYYSANLMKVAVYGRANLQELESWAIKYLSPIKNRNIKRPKFSKDVYLEGALPTYVEMKPYGEKDEKKLSIRFSMPKDTRGWWKGKAVDILGGILATEIEGSITSDLKRKGLIISLVASGNYSSFRTTFSISMELTDKGLQQKDLILERIFAHLAKLRSSGLKEYVFADSKKRRQMDYDNFEVGSAANLVTFYSEKMRLHESRRIDERTRLLWEYRPQDFQTLIDFLVPNNAMIMLTYQGAKTDKLEPHFKIDYSARPLSQSETDRYKKAELQPAGYPIANNYLAKLNPRLVEGETDSEFPVQLTNNERASIWYSRASDRAQAKGNIYVELVTGQGGGNAYESVVGRYFAELLLEEMNEWIYQLTESGLGLSIYYNNYGLTVQLTGYSQWSPEVLSEFYKRFNNLKFDENIFALVKQRVEQQFFEAGFEDANDMAFEHYLGPARNPMKPSYAEVMPFVSQIKVEDVEEFKKQFHKKLYVRSFIQGNLESKSTSKLVMSVFDQWGPEALENGSDYRNSVVMPAPGEQRAIIARSSTGNHAFVRAVELGERNGKTEAVSRVLYKLWSSDFYNQMRTLQKLGYFVYMDWAGGTNAGVFYVIQSPTNSASDLRRRVNKWQKEKLAELTKLKSSNFKDLKRGLTAQIERGDTSFSRSYGRIKQELFSIEDKAHQENLKKALVSLTRDQFVAIITAAFRKENIRQTTVYVDAKDAPETRPLLGSETLFSAK